MDVFGGAGGAAGGVLSVGAVGAAVGGVGAAGAGADQVCVGAVGVLCAPGSGFFQMFSPPADVGGIGLPPEVTGSFTLVTGGVTRRTFLACSYLLGRRSRRVSCSAAIAANIPRAGTNAMSRPVTAVSAGFAPSRSPNTSALLAAFCELTESGMKSHSFEIQSGIRAALPAVPPLERSLPIAAWPATEALPNGGLNGFRETAARKCTPE